ncbi:MAG: serine hydrolase domain-containing protein [Balneola sp.]|jgi:CubicO group peptidase (beta-lactamase class C family)
MKKLFAVLIFIQFIGCSKTNKTNPEKIIEDFISQVKSDLQSDNINGSISVAVLQSDDILTSDTFGYLNHNKTEVADSETLYRIGSVTKSFTGFLLAKLHQDSVLNMNNPVEKYLPEVKTIIGYDNYTPITFKQLASHTSGLDREIRNRDANFGSVSEWEEKLINALPQTSFRSEPGERFRYSNIGYAILGLAISRAANKPYMQLIEEEILSPLNMTNTFFVVPEEKTKKLAEGMAGGPTAELNFQLPLDEHNGRGYRIPNGGLYSTISDLAEFMKACMGESKLLNEESLDMIHTTKTPTTGLRANYSLGFDLYSDQGINTIGHGGSTPGYSAHFEFERDSKYGVILLRNYNFGNTNLDLRSNALLRTLSTID